MKLWHFIIPFFYGENQFVLIKGGAPVRRKVAYLRQTVASLQRLGVHSRITIFVCNEPSRQRALEVHSRVELIDCHPKHLPLETVKRYQTWFTAYGSQDDIVAFNEDDQILHMADSVRDDIENAPERVVFSPHRWSRQFLYFRRKSRPVYYLHGHRGLLDNIGNESGAAEFCFNHRYRVQPNRHAAYAASWFMKGSFFCTLDLETPLVELESASYVVFDSGIPVLKLDPDGDQSLSDFIVDHLSGYDYNKRLIK